LGYPDAEISISCVDDSEIRQLNKNYRNKDKSTNVLSFSMLEGDFADINPNLLGDLVISLETADKEAVDYGITLNERMSQLLVHGILHLVGFDHEESDSENRRMEKKSLEILSQLGENRSLPYF